MVKYKTSGIGCVLTLEARGKFMGDMSVEQLEEIDEVMLSLGMSRTGQRTNVDTTTLEGSVGIEYAYQESLTHRTISNAIDRLEAFTELEGPAIVIDATTAEFVDRGDENG